MYRKLAFFWVKLPCETIGEEAIGTCFYPDICKKLSRQGLIPLHCPFQKVGDRSLLQYLSDIMTQRSILGVKPAAPSDIAGLCKNISHPVSHFQTSLSRPGKLVEGGGGRRAQAVLLCPDYESA